MLRRVCQALVCAALLCAWSELTASSAQAQQAYGRAWGSVNRSQDWTRFYHYPYVYYPQNFWGSEYYRSSNDMYHRYPQEMQIPVYNKQWHNEYPQTRLYHRGHHFIMDTF